MLAREEILAKDFREFGSVDVPEWGGEVRLASLTEAAWIRICAQANRAREAGDADAAAALYRVATVAACVVDDQGELVFGPADIEKLAKQPAGLIGRIYDAAIKVCGKGGEGGGAAKDAALGE